MTPSAHPPLAIVVAVGRNSAIGLRGALPWRMPGDLARFRALTIGKPMIMGRRTFASIGKALPGRESIVVSRESTLALPDGVHLAADPAAALRLAEVRAAAMGAAEIALIGGATLFDAMIGDVERLYLTYVDLAPDADTFFSPVDTHVWRETSRHVPDRHAEDEAGCTFVNFVRR